MVKSNEGDLKEVKPKKTSRATGRTTSRAKRKITPRPSAATVRIPEYQIKLRSLWPGRLIISENTVPSGKRYEFPFYGSILTVDMKDVDGLLSRRRGTRPCCGPGEVEQKYFELA